ncbi:hypothetical protein B566_EDAN000687 [Ephemera danica]|nr:hypothetical protein B566_EDAN000687 [Ephemera danica]
MVHFPGLCSDLLRWKAMGVRGWDCNKLRAIIERMSCEKDPNLVPARRCANLSYRPLLQGGLVNDVCFAHRSKCEPTLRLSGGDLTSDELTRAFVSGGYELGAPYQAGETSERVFRGSRSSVHNGRRWSSLESHLRPAMGRPNLHVMLNTHVAKVVFSAALGAGERRAEGVLLLSGAVVLARREVILSAGALGSPQLLLLSGVGPAQQLNAAKIPQVVESPVGANLHDHLNMPIYVSLAQKGLSLTLAKLRSIRQLANYLLRKEGLLASTAVTGAAVWPPHIGLMLFAMGTPDEANLGAIANYLPETFQGLFPLAANASQEGAVILATCLQPRSRGTVTLKDADPSSPPVIDPRYLNDPEDVACMTRAFRLAVRVAESKAFRKLGARVHLPQLRHCGVSNVRNDGYMECVLRTAAITGYHPAGTCPMGGSGRHSVLDSELRVRGVNGLRVVDASVFPTPTSGTPNSVLLALAERAANLLIIEHATSN